MNYPVVLYGNPLLRRKAKPIEKDHEGLNEIIENMWETMYNSDGVGLAAPQAGLSIRLFVIDATAASDEEPELNDFKKVFINPEIVERTGEEWIMNEGCLSLPEIREDVKRSDRVRIKYLDENFQPHDEVYTGYAARIIQHEYDHLEGILFIDHLTPLKKRLLKSKLRNIASGRVIANYKVRVPFGKT